MKNFILGLLICCTGSLAMAQQKPTDLDNSPLDVSYYPPNYPILKMRAAREAKDGPLARVLYSRPQKKGRSIFGNEVKYNEIWRLGANEATELELFRNATLGGKKLAKGRYTLFCIPTETKWTLIVSKDNYNWGSFTFKSRPDDVKIDAPVQRNSEVTEAFTIYFDNGNSNNLVMLWDDVKVSVPISF